MFGKILVFCAAALLISCSSQQQQDAAKTGAPKGATGPGDADDRPLTMSGSSLDFTWDDCEFGGLVPNVNDTLSYAFSNQPNVSVNEIRYVLKNDTGAIPGRVVFRRRRAQPVAITIHYGNAAAVSREVLIATDAEENAAAPTVKVRPANLRISSIAGALAHIGEYEPLGAHLLKHPKKGRKVRTIEFSGVAIFGTPTGPHGCTGTNPVVCTVNTGSADNDSRLRIESCRPNAVSTCKPAVP